MVTSFELTLSGTKKLPNFWPSKVVVVKLEGWLLKGGFLKQHWNEKRLPAWSLGKWSFNRVVVKGEGLLHFTLLKYLEWYLSASHVSKTWHQIIPKT